jgi:hypothetical protein
VQFSYTLDLRDTPMTGTAFGADGIVASSLIVPLNARFLAVDSFIRFNANEISGMNR